LVWSDFTSARAARQIPSTLRNCFRLNCARPEAARLPMRRARFVVAEQVQEGVAQAS